MGAKKKIEVGLGMEVKDTVTGFKGIVTAMTYFLNGCVRIGVDPPVGKDGKQTESVYIDAEQLTVVKVATPARKLWLRAAATGGPRPDITRRADCPR